METGLEQVITDNVGAAAQVVLSDLVMPEDVRKIIRSMKAALSRTKKAVDMVGLAETKAIDTAFAGVGQDVLDATLLVCGLALKEQDGLRLIVRASRG